MESLEVRRQRAARILRKLKKQFPNAACRLTYRSPFELLVKTILSAQSTDERVNDVGNVLFHRLPTAEALADASRALVESLIKPTGLFRHKARHIQSTARLILDRHNGIVPSDMNELTALPGVGRKTANVIRGTIFGHPAVVVDTHVARIANLLKWTDSRDATRIETDLMKLLPKKEWTLTAHLLGEHGRQTCIARRPKCRECPIEKDCPSSRL